MDIGCYPINTSRFVLESEPNRVLGQMFFDPDFNVDRLASVILDFGSVQSSFVCGTQHVPYQRMHFFCTKGRVEIEIPFNAPPDRPCRIFVCRGDLDPEVRTLPVCDQYTIQGDLFSRAIRGEIDQALPIEDSVCNMAVIDAVFRSAETSNWVDPQHLV
jgi:predicted dehydrogenase